MKKFHLQRLVNFFLLLSISVIIGSVSAPAVEAARKSADEIYVQPIEGLDKTGFFGPTQQQIAKALIKNNYKVFCAAPAKVMDAHIGDSYLRYLKLHKDQIKKNELQTSLDSPDEILQPLVVDDSGADPSSIFDDSKVSYVQSRLNSKASDDPIKENLATADYNKLLSFDEQLAIKKKAQKNIAELCNKLDIPSSKCPANITVPGTSIKIEDVNIPNLKDLLHKQILQHFLESKDAKGTANLPLAKYVKKPAYKVTCIEQSKPGDQDTALYKETNLGSVMSSLFGSFFHTLNFRKDECYVETIYVDANGTEDESKNAVEAHNLTRGFFNSYADTVAQEKKYQQRKQDDLATVLEKINKGFTADDRVNLVDSANTQTKAIAHMINGIAPNCQQSDIRTETSPTITAESKFAAGGARYKATGRTADQDWGMLNGIKVFLKSIITTGKESKSEIENKSVTVETFIIAPYDSQVTLDQFFSTKAEYEVAKKKSESEWPTHALFNKDVGEGQVYTLKGSTKGVSQEFYDPKKCDTTTGYYDANGNWVAEANNTDPNSSTCNNRYTLGISDIDQEIGLPVSQQIRANAGRPLLAVLSKANDPQAYAHVEKYSSSAEANNEKLLKGTLGTNKSQEKQVVTNPTPVAKCQAGSPRVGAGEDADHVCETTSQSCSADQLKSAQKPQGSCTLLQAQHKIADWKKASDGKGICNDHLYSSIACTYPNTLIQNPVDSNGHYTDKDTGMTACDYVVAQAVKAGVSPRFALAMWGEESGWSHYKDKTDAFGVHSSNSSQKLDLNYQVAGFLGTVKSNSDYLQFMKQYSNEKESGNVFCNNAAFPARLKAYYNYL